MSSLPGSQAGSIVPQYLQQTTYGQLLLWRLNRSTKASGLSFNSKAEDFEYNFERLSKAGILGAMPSRYTDYENLYRLFGLNPEDESNEDNENAVVMEDDEKDEQKSSDESPSNSIRYNYAMMDIDYDDQDDPDSSRAETESLPRRKRSRSSILQRRDSINILKHYPLPYKLIIPNANNCTFSQDSLTLNLPSNSKSNDTVLIKANNSIPSQTGLFYYETTILPANPNLNSFNSNSPINVSIGVIHSYMESPAKFPGLESGSFGYNAYDGTIVANQTTNRSFSSPFGVGDVIGCGIDYTNNLIFFTKNGVSLGVAFREIIDDSILDEYIDDKKNGICGLTPVFGIKGGSIGGIKVNFGMDGEGFRFDIEGYLSKTKDLIIEKILTKDVDEIKIHYEKKDIDLIMKELVGEYFDHLGYIDISKTFKEEVFKNENVLLKSEIDEEILKIRQSIRNDLLNGEIDSVINLIDEKFPKIFKSNKDLLFKLNCLKFLHFIKINQINEAILYGKKLRSEFTSISNQEYLNDISSLLAFQNPETSEFGNLLKIDEVLNTLELINSEILQTLGKQNISDLERLFRHDGALLSLLMEKGIKESLVLRLDDFLE